MVSELARIRVIDYPKELPGHCAICGSSVGKMIDFDMFMEFHGAVYICVENCGVEMANAFGYHSPHQWNTVIEHLSSVEEEVKLLREQNDGLRDDLAAISRFHNIPVVDRTPELDVDSIPEKPEPDPNQLAFDFDVPESRSDEQDDEQRPANVRYDDDSLDIIDI